MCNLSLINSADLRPYSAHLQLMVSLSSLFSVMTEIEVVTNMPCCLVRFNAGVTTIKRDTTHYWSPIHSVVMTIRYELHFVVVLTLK